MTDTAFNEKDCLAVSPFEGGCEMSEVQQADRERCEAQIRRNNSLRFGIADWVRCEKKPYVVVKEKRSKRSDGQLESMSLCETCLEQFNTRNCPEDFTYERLGELDPENPRFNDIIRDAPVVLKLAGRTWHRQRKLLFGTKGTAININYTCGRLWLRFSTRSRDNTKFGRVMAIGTMVSAPHRSWVEQPDSLASPYVEELLARYKASLQKQLANAKNWAAVLEEL